MSGRRQRPLTRRQQDLLFIVGQNAPVTARDVHYHLPSLSPEAARSAIARVETRGLLDRQYTGLRRGERCAFVLSTRGAEALDALGIDDDYDPAEA